MWAIGRRTGLFVVSYAPLAAMFLVLEWPTGWSAGDLGRLAAWVAAVAAFALLLPAIVMVTGGFARATVGVATAAVVAVLAFGLVHDWAAPMTLHPMTPRTAATASAVAFGFCVLAALIVAMLLYNAGRTGEVRWTVTDPRDQGGAVAGYLATYLLPLLGSWTGGWRITAAYGIYLVTLYVVYVRSEGLVLINPTLYLFRYRIYDVHVDSSEERYRRRVLLLTKLRITGRTQVEVVPLGDQSYLAKPVTGA